MAVHNISRILQKQLRHGRFSSLVQSRSAGFKFIENKPNADWHPGEYPITAEDYKQAAARYGMRVEDYKPLPNDGRAWGDWPDIQSYGTRDRDALGYHWDFPRWKRDYMDPVPIGFDGTRDWLTDPSAHIRRKEPTWFILFAMLGIPGLYIVFMNSVNDQIAVDRTGPLVAEKVFPDEGTHYFFCNPDQEVDYMDLNHTGGHENGRWYPFHVYLKTSIFTK